MAYTAIAKMRKKNFSIYGAEVGPAEPKLYEGKNRNDLKSASLRFLHNACEGLKFDSGTEAEEDRSGQYQGTSLNPNQIPYNMQMDVNRLCLEKTLEQFIDSGSAQDAYLVYYCFLEIFLGHYGKSKKMIELLSEFESNGSSLLMKHRDHYSHSVYVFALGLAIYETNTYYRRAFQDFYKQFYLEFSGKEYSDSEAANLFLEYWGFASLFHDIGYPFELPFEQVISYFEVNRKKRGKENPYIAYHAMDTLSTFSAEESAHLRKLFGRDFKSTDELFAYGIHEKLGKEYDFSEEYLLDKISSKPGKPNEFGYFMDHAYFSSLRLYRELVSSLGAEKITKMHVDALTAILLHNSLYKFCISFYKDPEKAKQPLKAEIHPLAYLLMICDELQCWDRTAYGRNSRTELHPMGADFDFSDNEISAVYYYDRNEQEKIDEFEKEYRKWTEDGEQGKPPRLKAYSDMAEKEQRFRDDIEHIIDTSIIPLTVKPDTRTVNRKNKKIYLSDSNFMHLFDFAVSLHGRNKGPDVGIEELEKQFETLSLEYQLSTINRAKNFSRYLDAIHCFYTDKPVDYEMITEFTPEHAAIFAPMEHERWVREHLAMGWTSGDSYESLKLPEEFEDKTPDEKKKAFMNARREQMRMHKLAMDGNPTSEEIKEHYLTLPVSEQDKDWKPFNSMLRLLKKFDGIRIYSLD